MSLTLYLATNDRHGNVTDRITALEVAVGPGDTLLRLDTIDIDGVPYTDDADQVRIGERWFPIAGEFSRYVGNLAWNAVRITPETAAHLLGYLWRSEAWQFEEGYETVADAWDRGEVTAELLTARVSGL